MYQPPWHLGFWEIKHVACRLQSLAFQGDLSARFDALVPRTICSFVPSFTQYSTCRHLSSVCIRRWLRPQPRVAHTVPRELAQIADLEFKCRPASLARGLKGATLALAINVPALAPAWAGGSLVRLQRLLGDFCSFLEDGIRRG